MLDIDHTTTRFLRGHICSGASSLLCGAAAWPLAAQAQQKLRRVGVLFVLSATDPENQARLAIFVQGLQDFGWTEGHNIQFDVRYGDDNTQKLRSLAHELVQSALT